MKLELILSPDKNVAEIPSSTYFTSSAIYNSLGISELHNSKGIKPISIGTIFQIGSRPKYEHGKMHLTGKLRLNVGVFGNELSLKVLYKLCETDKINVCGNILNIRSVSIVKQPTLFNACLWSPVYGILTKAPDLYAMEARRLGMSISEVKSASYCIGNRSKYLTPNDNMEETATALKNLIENKFYTLTGKKRLVKLAINNSSKVKIATMKNNAKNVIWSAMVMMVSDPDVQSMVFDLGLGGSNAMGIGEVKLVETKPV